MTAENAPTISISDGLSLTSSPRDFKLSGKSGDRAANGICVRIAGRDQSSAALPCFEISSARRL
jgi:hypothetical protein